MPRPKQLQEATGSNVKSKSSRKAAKNAGEQTGKRAETTAVANSITWPAISRKTLESNVLLADQIIVFANFLSPTECHALLNMAHQLPMTITPPPKRDEAYRDNWRFSVDDPTFADRLWRAGLDVACTQLEGGLHRQAVGLNSNIRLYRYDSTQRFGQHYDDSIRDKQGNQSEWTLLIYLNGDGDGEVTSDTVSDAFDSYKELAIWSALPSLRGGQTVFYGPGRRQVTSIAPVAGMALLHRHGARCLLHEALEVKEGCKWVLRSDIMFASQ